MKDYKTSCMDAGRQLDVVIADGMVGGIERLLI